MRVRRPGGALAADQLLVVSPGGGRVLAPHSERIAEWLKTGGQLLAIGLDQAELKLFLSSSIQTRDGEHIAAFVEPFEAGSPFAGISAADLHNRDPRVLPLITGGAEVVGSGTLGRVADGGVTLCQIVPWRFDPEGPANQRRTFRRAAFLGGRVLANLGGTSTTALLERFARPVRDEGERRWLEGLYLDVPEEWDDPYRFFRW